MAHLYDKAFFKDSIVPLADANLSIASSAILYGLSVYTVFPVSTTSKGLAAFRLPDHYQRLINSARIIGIDGFEKEWTYEKFEEAVKKTVQANALSESALIRATVHVSDLVPGTRSRGLGIALSMFIYRADPIIPVDGARLKTSVWRRTPDYSIPSRAKVNGAYVNSVLAKQDALDSGYDDCIFLDIQGHVCELSAANIFMVREGTLITPGASSDVLEGISRRTLIELATDLGFKTQERTIDLTELYIADEVFACGTSTLLASIIEIDARTIGGGSMGPLTKKLQQEYTRLLAGENETYQNHFTALT